MIQILSKLFKYTFRKFHEFIKYDQYIRKALEKTFIFNDFKKTLKRYIEGNIVSTYSLKLTKTKLKKIKLYQKVKIVRNRLPDIVVNKSNVVTMNMIRVMKRKHEEDVVEVAQKTMKIKKGKIAWKRAFKIMEIGVYEAQKGCSSTSQTARRQRKGLCSCSRRRLDVCKKRH